MFMGARMVCQTAAPTGGLENGDVKNTPKAGNEEVDPADVLVAEDAITFGWLSGGEHIDNDAYVKILKKGLDERVSGSVLEGPAKVVEPKVVEEVKPVENKYEIFEDPEDDKESLVVETEDSAPENPNIAINQIALSEFLNRDPFGNAYDTGYSEWMFISGQINAPDDEVLDVIKKMFIERNLSDLKSDFYAKCNEDKILNKR